MTHVLKDLEKYKRLNTEAQYNIRKDLLVAKLTKEMEFFKRTSLALAKDCELFKST
jgi:hypothetical protein